MLGFLIGTACLIGLIKVARFGRRGRWGRGGGCGHGGYGGYGDHHDHGWHDHDAPWGDGGGRGPGGPFGRWFLLRKIFSRLDTTPGQEKVIKNALEGLRGAADRVRTDAKAARPEVANAIRQEQFDETLFGEISHKIDEAAQAMRRATIDAFAQIHSVLDDRQRKLLADLVESGPGFRPWGSPYRGVSL